MTKQYLEGYKAGWQRCWGQGHAGLLLAPEELLLLAIFHPRPSFRIWLGKRLRRLSMRLARWQYDLLNPYLILVPSGESQRVKQKDARSHVADS